MIYLQTVMGIFYTLYLSGAKGTVNTVKNGQTEVLITLQCCAIKPVCHLVISWLPCPLTMKLNLKLSVTRDTHRNNHFHVTKKVNLCTNLELNTSMRTKIKLISNYSNVNMDMFYIVYPISLKILYQHIPSNSY